MPVPQEAQALVRRLSASGSLSLPAVPRVVRQLLQRLADDKASVSDIVAIVEQEPYIAARSLRLANSHFFAGRHAVASIADAVPLIGTRTLKTLVVSGGLMAAFVSVPGVNLRSFWWHAQVTAAAARSMASPMRLDAEAAYLAGLLSRVGHLILCNVFPDSMAAVLERASVQSDAELAALERESCGFSFPEVGAAWLDSMGLPADVSSALARQLDPHIGRFGLDVNLMLARKAAVALELGCDSSEIWSSVESALLERGLSTHEQDALRRTVLSLGDHVASVSEVA